MGQAFRPAAYLPIAASVVRVEADLEQGRLSVGSGVTVAPAVIATNCHVVRDATSIRVAGGGATWYIDAERGDLRRDVCFLRAPGWMGRPVMLARGDHPALGSTVVALGFTAGAAITPHVGTVSALHDFDGASVIESNASFNSGASGGGLFDDEGTMVGLLAFRRRDSTTSYYALPVEWVREAMARDGDWNEVHPLSGPAAFWQGDESQLPAFMRIDAAR
ncbi:MAG TPA: serine protease [Usitatibacter sp.]|jgi:S1-C subfamily serine protease|nr:serine protease [Usitatibacter sp.]